MTDSSWLPVSLPHGLGEHYVLPRSLGLTAVFSSYDYRRVRRPLVTEPVELAAYGRTRVLQISGYQLDQPDADVFMQLVALSLNSSAPVQVGAFRLVGVTVGRNELLRLLGRGERAAGDKRWLHESLDRLVGARFRFDRPATEMDAADDYDDDTWRTGLVHEWALVGKRTLQILLNHDLARLYADSAWSLINRKQRQALSSNKMAQWLHTFYAGFKAPDPIRAQALRKPLARLQMQDSKYIDALTAAVAALATATGWTCQLAKGYVVVNKATRKAAAKAAPAASTPVSGTPSAGCTEAPADEGEQAAFSAWLNAVSFYDLHFVCCALGRTPSASVEQLRETVRDLWHSGTSLSVLQAAADEI